MITIDIIQTEREVNSLGSFKVKIKAHAKSFVKKKLAEYTPNTKKKSGGFIQGMIRNKVTEGRESMNDGKFNNAKLGTAVRKDMVQSSRDSKYDALESYNRGMNEHKRKDKWVF